MLEKKSNTFVICLHLFYCSFCFPLIFFPFYILGWKWWAILPCAVLSYSFNFFTFPGEVIPYVKALIVILKGGFPSWITFLYILLFIVWVIKNIAAAVEMISTIKRDFFDNREKKEPKPKKKRRTFKEWYHSSDRGTLRSWLSWYKSEIFIFALYSFIGLMALIFFAGLIYGLLQG